MNPQHFQNMGVGSGMPMQINPAFNMTPQMGGHMGGQPMPMQGMGQQNAGHPQIQKHIFTTLQSQGPFSGWQATVNPNERAAQVKLLVDSLRLVRPPVELPRALEVALQFERKCFSQSGSKDEYWRECSEKLGKIRDQRAQQMNQAAANNMQGMQGMQMNQNFPMQMGQNMENMGQQNMAPNMGMPNMQRMQQLQQQQMLAQRNMNMPNPAQMMPNQPLLQGQQNPQQNAQSKPNDLTLEDNKAINARAAELAKSTPKDKMRMIIDQMNPQIRANLGARKIDPVLYYFRAMATKEYKQQKAMEGGNQMQNNMDQMSNQNQPMNQTVQGNQTGFVNEMGRYQGLQAEGLRSQEEGQMVVPASNNNSAVPDHMRMTQHMLANSQRMGQQNPGVNQGYLEQQRRLQQQQQVNKMQQAARLQAQENARAQAAGMPPNQIQNPPQAGTPLPTINRPVNLNGQGVSPQPGSRPPSRTPVMNQQGQMQGQAMNMQEAQNRERALASYSVQIQNILRQKPTNQWKATLEAIQQSSAMQRSASQQPQSMQRQPSAQVQNGAFLGGANIGTPMQQSLSAGAMSGQNEVKQPGMSQNQSQVNPDILRQRQAAIQQQQQRMQAEQAGNPASQPQQPQQLNPAQMDLMDSQPVPPTVLAGVRQHTQLPVEIKTWLNLKQWAMNSPITTMPMPRLMQFQASHFAFLMRSRQQAQQRAQLTPQQQQVPPQGQIQNVPGQVPFQNQQQVPVPSDQDIQRLRAKNPRLREMSDEQIRQALMNRQRQQLQQAIQAQTAQRAGIQPGATTPAQQQQKPPPQPQPQSQKPQPQPTTRPPSQASAQSKPQQASIEKGIKRPNEGIKTEAPALGPKPILQPPNQRQMTREQFNALPADKKAAYMKAQHVSRLMNLGKQVASTAPKWQPTQLNQAARQRLLGKLGEAATKNMLSRFDQLLLAFWEMRQDEAEIRGLILNKLQMFAQFEPTSIQNRTWVPLQNFSITFERADEILKDLAVRFQQMTAGLARQQQPAQLTPENLSRLQEQEDRKKSVKSGKDVPPAPTSAQPPFQFGDRGQGAPKYGGTALKQEDLKLDPKRRKKNPPAGQTPASQLSATPSASSPPVTKPQVPAPTFRCMVPNCDRSKQGFPNQAELDHHTNAVHKIDTEPVTDPLAFLDASLRDAFNLDENFKQIKKATSKAPPMEKTLSKTGSAVLKGGSKPATPTPMAKIPSQSGRHLSGQFNKDDAGLRAQADDWEHTKITLEELNNIFGDMEWEEAVPAAALELQDKFLAQYAQSDEWQQLLRQPTDTLTDTPEKSTSSTDPANKEPEATTEDAKKDDLIVDLSIEGLDLSSLEELENVSDSAPNGDTAMGEAGSPFELLDKPALTAEQQFLLDNDIDYTRPGALNAGQKRLMDFIVEPLVVGKPPLDDVPWEEIDWDAEEKQRQEDVRLGTPGAWNGKGFNRFP